jgi:tetratricopeptide (TPR) repeat protein
MSGAVVSADPIQPPESLDFASGALEAEALLDAGGFAEAIVLLAALAEARPDNPWVWASLGRCHEGLGDGAAELEACLKAIELDPSLGRVRLRAAMLQDDFGQFEAAAANLRIICESHPGNAKAALRLARVYEALGQGELEAGAWTRMLALQPDNVEAHRRLGELHWQAGRSLEAAPHLKRVLDAMPDKPKLWPRYAHCLEEGGDLKGAEAAWARALEVDSADVEAAERLAKLRLFGEGGSGARSPAAKFRLAVLGNCQAYAMARCMRALNPDIEVVSIGWGEVRSSDKAQRVVQSLSAVDAVLAQPVNVGWLEEFRPKALVKIGPTCAFYPPIHFTGFHPDGLLANGEGLVSLIGDWHSTLIVAGFRMGLPPARTQELFNAYIFGVLGYFEENAKAVEFLRLKGRQLDWDLGPELEAWRKLGVFVHTPNHPRVEVMMSLARRACERLGFPANPDAATPADPFDRLGDWPLYPEIGKRLGLVGDLTFVSPFERGRAFDLEGAIDWYYAVYAKAPPEALVLPRVDWAMKLLRAEGI